MYIRIWTALTAALLCGACLVQSAMAQSTFVISGRITDAATGEGIPFANVAIKGLSKGTVSDAEGKYVLRTSQTGDSLLVSSLGFQNRAYRILPIESQTIDVQLAAAATRLQEVRVYAKGGDPAYRVIREVVRRRDRFDPAKLSGYQYENYTKIEAYVNNFSRKRKNGKGPGPVGRLLGKLPAVTDDNGDPAVPVFISETFSELYARSNPEKFKERVLKSQVRGVGVTDGSLVAQLTGASFQQYNFYRNYLNVLRKDIPSPVGAQWETMYTFRLKDTVTIDNAVCYEVEFEPKRASDLAFSGSVWIDTTQFALAQLEVSVGKRANINFVDEIRIEQEWTMLPSGARLPTQTHVMIDTDQPTPRSPGGLVRFFSAARNIVEGQPREVPFYDPSLELSDDYKVKDPSFWSSARPDSLSPEEWRAMRVVDSVRNVPLVKVAGDAIRLGVVGYQPLGKLNVDVGPLLYTYANNTIEGHRIRLGLRTNTGFSRKWLLSGYVAYGTTDQTWKYSGSIEYILNRKPWTVLGVRRSYDMERVGVSADNLGGNSLFYAYSRFGAIRRPYFQEDNLAYFRREVGRGFTQTFALRNRTFDPLFAFAFRPQAGDDDQRIRNSYRTTEFIWETRFAPDEVMLQNDNVRVSAGATRKPILTLRYTAGIRDLLGGDFTYHRVAMSMRHSFRMGVLGRTYYTVGAGIIPATLPYPLLYTPLGNESLFYVGNAFNLMNYFEFVADRYAELQFEHNFSGLLFNRIPLLRRLKWRELVTAKVLAGSVSQANLNTIPPADAEGRPVQGFRALGNTPYVEVGYGIDNILKVLRIDAIHRLTYRDNTTISGLPVTPFSIKVSGWLSF